MIRHRRIITLVGAVAVLASLAVGPTAAFAQDQLADPSAAQYDPGIPGSGVAGDISGGGPGSGSGASGGPPAAASATPADDENLGSLPFTGVDLMIVAGVALVLLGTGVALRRLSVPYGPRT
jgi:hypothetical protein